MSKDSEVGNRVIVIDPAQVLVMSRALNDALKVVGQGHWCSPAGGRGEPGTKGYLVVGALEVRGVDRRVWHEQ